MRIRSDLEGVVYAQSEGGVVCLEAGDTVPDGVEIGEHLTTEPEDLDDADESSSDSDSDDNAGDGDGDDADESDTEDDEQPEAEGSPEDLEKGTEHARGRRGRRSTPGSESDG